MSKEIIEPDVRDLILEQLKKDERNLKWLCRNTGIPYGTAYSCFMERRFKLSDKNLDKINDFYKQKKNAIKKFGNGK